MHDRDHADIRPGARIATKREEGKRLAMVIVINRVSGGIRFIKKYWIPFVSVQDRATRAVGGMPDKIGHAG